MRFVSVLVLDITLFSVLSLSSLSLKSLCFLERSLSSLLLLCPVGVIALGIVYVGVNNLLGRRNSLNGLNCNRLITVIECYKSCSNGSLVLLSVICLVICCSGEFLLHLRRSNGFGLFLGNISLNVCINSLCSLIPRSCLSSLFERLVFLLLLLHSLSESSKLFTLCTSVSLSALAIIVCVGGNLLRLSNESCSLITINVVCFYLCVFGRNNAYSRSFAVAVRNEQYYLLFGIGTGKRSLIIIIAKSSCRNSLDHDCILFTLIALCSSLFLESLSLGSICSEELLCFLNAGVTPLCLELFLKLLSRLDRENVLASERKSSLLFSLSCCKKLFCLLNTGINLLLLLHLFGLLGSVALKSCELICTSVSLFDSFSYRSLLLSLLLSLVLFKKGVILLLLVN